MQNIIVKKDGYASVQYDSPDSLIYIKKLKITDYPNNRVIRHRHEDLEFILVLSGEFLCTINGKENIIKAGGGICINSARFHSYSCVKGAECEFLCILLNPALLCTTKQTEETYILPMIDKSSQDLILLDRKTPWQNEIIEKLKEIYKIYSETYNTLQIVGNFFSIWQIYYSNRSPLPSSPSAAKSRDILKDTHEFGIRHTLKEMLMFIYENYGKRITLREICAAGRICKSKCYEIFSKYLHDTPIEFLSSYRIYKALELLRDSDMSVLDIAYRTGFSTSSYFTETFKDRIGCTPTQYRKNKDDPAFAKKEPTSFSFFVKH